MSERYRVYYIPQVPMKAFTVEVTELDAAQLLLTTIIDFSIFEFENKVKPDYSDAAGIERWEEDSETGWGWFELDDYEQEEILQAQGKGN